MARWTIRPSTWVVVFVGLMGVAVEVTEAEDLSVCRNSCSAVPIDLWPYCCETHSTCCEEFANSCIHDCLPRVSSGDVSAVEERPGLCCALYNLCCFRETPRISSIRHGAVPQQNLPFTHRFSTLPGGPTRNRQSPVVIPQQTKITINETPKSEQPQERNDNRRPGNFNRPQPTRNTASSFRDAQRSKNEENTRIGISSSPQASKRPNHRFDVREPNNARPTISENSKPQVQKSETEQFSRPQVSGLPSKPRKFNRPASLVRPLETRKTDTPEAREPIEELTNTNTPKFLDRPNTGPRKLVRPELNIRPTSPRKLGKPEPETVKISEQDTQEEERKSNRLFPSQPLQIRKLTLSVPTDQSTKPQETSQAESVQVDRPIKIARPGLLIRPGESRKNIRPALDVTEKPEKVNKPESDDRPRGPRLLINRPNIKNQILEKTDSDVDKTPETPLEIENLSKDTPNTGNAYLPEKAVPEEGEKDPISHTSTAAGVTRKGTISPIRKVKRIRTSAPSKLPQSQSLSIPAQGSGTSDSQKTNSETLKVTPTARPQVSIGRSRSRQEVTTFRPHVTQERSRKRIRVTQERSRGNTQVTQERSVGNTQVTQERSRERPQEISRERTQVTQERSEGRTQVTGGRSRDQLQATRKRPTGNAQTRSEKSEKDLRVQEDSPNRPSAEEKPVEMQKIITKISTDIPTIKEEKIMEVPQEMARKTAEDSQTMMDKSDDVSQGADVVTKETPQEPREQSTSQPQIKVMKLVRPQVAIKSLGPQQPQEARQKPDQPQEIRQTENQSQAKQGADRLAGARQSFKPQQETRQSFEPQATRQRPSAQQATRQSSEPQQRGIQSSEPQQRGRQSSEPQQATRQRSSAQPATRQRSSAQPATRQRSDRQPAPRQSTGRTRGRLTARQQLAVSQTDDQP